jgi:hypothetical protein
MSLIHHMTLGFFDHEAVARGRLLVSRRVDNALVQELQRAYRECFGADIELGDKRTGDGVIRIVYLGPRQAYEEACRLGYLAHKGFGMSAAEVSAGELIFPEGSRQPPELEAYLEWFGQLSPQVERARSDEMGKQRHQESLRYHLRDQQFREQVRAVVDAYLARRNVP